MTMLRRRSHIITRRPFLHDAAVENIKRLVSIPQLLRHFRWPSRHRGRADCGLCKGSRDSTVAFNQKVWRCHRCGAGGDVFSLVRAVLGCGFRDALNYVAELARVNLADYPSAEVRHEIAARQQQQQRIDCAAQRLADAERALRLECRDLIHRCDRVLRAPAPWSEKQWRMAWAASILRDEFLLPEYSLLSLGAIESRTQFVLADWRERSRIATAIRWAGGVRTDAGQFVEVLSE